LIARWVNRIARTHELSFRSFGVRARVIVPAAQVDRALKLIPPGSEPCSPTELEATFELSADAADTYSLIRAGKTLAGKLGLELALDVLERDVRALVALRAPHHVFVHAGAVAHRGAAIVVPGASLAGKSTLVAALVRAGAQYYSDEFAPLGDDGLLYPFAKPLSLRNDLFVQTDHHVDALGGVAGERPLPVGVIIVTSYQAGAAWRPRRLTSGEAALALLSHAVPAQVRPAQALRAIRRSIENASVIEGARGEADAVAPLMLAELDCAALGK
jgi:hypothetical protein